MSDDLRRRAEELAGRLATDPSLHGVLSREEARLVHDLHVHQIELEIQNEELRRTEAALEAARARYFDLYDVAPVGYLTIDTGGRILEANLTAARLLGVTRGTLVDQPLSRLLTADGQDTFYLHRRRLFATGAPQVFELPMRRGDGSEFWARFEAAKAPAVNGASEVCRAIMSDITDRKRLDADRVRLERELQQAQKVEALSRMAGAVAHLFNNQLAVVMGNLELAIDDPTTAEARLTDARRAAEKAAVVSGLLLTYLGQSSGSHAPIDFSDALTTGLPLVRAALPAHVTLVVDFPTPGPAVNGNADQVRLLFVNLITNAWESVGDLPSTIHARISLEASHAIPAAHRYPVGWQPRDQGYACLEVRDPGCGIDDLEIEKIFDPFFTHKFTGRGLGLSVVLGILHAHSGGLVVDSRQGRDSGSTFRAYLPVSAEAIVAAPAIAVAAASEDNRRWSGTVLVAEDDAPLRAALRTTLERLGFTVLEATDGVDAVAVFRQHQQDIRLVMCDLTMPHLNGWETLAALHQLSPALPIILTSGYDEAHVMADERSAHSQVFLPKPYTAERLRQALGRALGPRQG